nr:IS3 family transposase [Alkalibacterium sp. AK22]
MFRSRKWLDKKAERHRKEESTRIGSCLSEFQAIFEYHQETGVSIQLLCEVLDVSRSGYYKWLNHTPSERELEAQQLKKRIKERFYHYKGLFGYRRITIALNRDSKEKQYDKKVIRRLMVQMGLRSHIRRSSGYSTKTSYVNIEDNLLNREFKADKPNQKWATDITHLRYGDGQKAYLSAIKDLYDGSIIAYKVGKFNNNGLVMETLNEAIERNSGASPLLHSDRGSQYTSKQYRQITTEAGITRSMSRVGKCIDNGPMESFFGHFKCESYKLKQYSTYEELEKDIQHYMNFYNYERFQETRNNLTPIEYRYQVAA